MADLLKTYLGRISDFRAEPSPYSIAARLSFLSRFPIGRNIYARNWDALIILDTCRIDALRTVAPEYEFLDADRICGRLSLGSQTAEWVAQTFVETHDAQIQETAYVTANAWVKAVLVERRWPETAYNAAWAPTAWNPVPPSTFSELHHVWRQATPKPYEYDGQASPHPNPRLVTDCAISTARRSNVDRLIVHYKQPHTPWEGRAHQTGRTQLHDYERKPWRYLRNGGEFKKVWGAYLDSLRFVLDDIEVFLRNFDGETVVITADHGEAFGKWGKYDHWPGQLNRSVRWVPWIQTSATDKGTRDPTVTTQPTTETSIESQLEALGYNV